MPTRNVVLTEHLEAFIGELVGSGRYKNASEVMREGLRIMERRESEERLKLQVLRKRLDVAEKEIEAGMYDRYSATLLDEIDAEEQQEFRQSDTE